MKLFFIKDTMRKTAGIIISIPGFLLLAISLFGLATEIEKNSREGIITAVALIIFSIVILIPGILLYRKGVNLARNERKIKKIAALLKTYRRIGLDELSRKIGSSIEKTEDLVNLAMELKLLDGRMDRTTGEIFIAGSVDEIIEIQYCPGCGARISEVFHRGETVKCSSCGGTFIQR